MYTKWCKYCEETSNLIIALLVLAIVLLAVIGVFFRYFLNTSLIWSEQVTRILFVWSTFLGAATLYRRAEHITMDIFLNKFPPRLRKIVNVFNEVVLLILFLVYLYYGMKLSVDNLHQVYGSMMLSPSVYYFAAPLSALLMIFYWVEKNIYSLAVKKQFTDNETHTEIR